MTEKSARKIIALIFNDLLHSLAERVCLLGFSDVGLNRRTNR
jgi:hypothetical protein